jgi:tetrahydromethanopterin S-methyltransferase subunit F
MLLTEYGFVIGAENDYNVVEVDKYVEGLFEAQGREGELKVGVLRDEGYWG